jgi:hypothetical protein
MTQNQWDDFVAGIEPTDIDLTAAPLIDNWYPIHRRGVMQIFGRVVGHPRHSDGYLTTSQVLRMAEDGSWVRTRSRFYRLGRRYVHRTDAEIAEAALGPAAPGSLVKVRDRRDTRPDFDPYPDLPLPPIEDEDTSARP